MPSARIAVQHQLGGLARDEFEPYLTHRLHLASCDLPLFAPNVLEALFQASRGLPRQIDRIAQFFDHRQGRGGGAIDLVMHMRHCCFRAAVFLERHTGRPLSAPATASPNAPDRRHTPTAGA